MEGRVGDLTDPERIRKVLDDVGLVVVGLAGERPEGFRLRPVDLMPWNGTKVEMKQTNCIRRFAQSLKLHVNSFLLICIKKWNVNFITNFQS